jgi:hypothetical protein
MRSLMSRRATPSRFLQRFSSSYNGASLQAVEILHGQIDAIDLHEFRQKAFIPERPLLITTKPDTRSTSSDRILSTSSIPAAVKWFSLELLGSSSQAVLPSQQYLAPFGGTILPYELIVDSNKSHTKDFVNRSESQDTGGGMQDLAEFFNSLLKGSSDGTFHRFNAPLSLFLQACRSKPTPRLYIAQAQIADLPKQLQDDLPIPKLVKEAGKGDVYDSNIWIGIPPTYTPLHKDPNPNLFVQLASCKRVRIFRPPIGAAIFREAQQRIGRSAPSSFRGEEMMEGPERLALDESVWSQSIVGKEGFEVIVSPGDALFIPKGWWHSIKSIGTGVTASVNWWFR